MKTSIAECNGFLFEYYNNDWVGASIGVNSFWEPHLTSFVNIYSKLYEIQNIIDIGANYGYHTLSFSKKANGKVFAFEPQSQNFELLKSNIRVNKLDNVTEYNFAIGDVNCDVKMPVMNDTMGQLNMGDITPNLIMSDTFTVTKSLRLDDLIVADNICLIKIDVQGWEKKVLQGAQNILKICKPILIVEFEYFQLSKTNTTCQELFDYIRKNNYNIFYLEYSYPSDHVCVHNDNLEEFRVRFKEYIFPHTQTNDVNNNLENGVNEKLVMPY